MSLRGVRKLLLRSASIPARWSLFKIICMKLLKMPITLIMSTYLLKRILVFRWYWERASITIGSPCQRLLLQIVCWSNGFIGPRTVAYTQVTIQTLCQQPTLISKTYQFVKIILQMLIEYLNSFGTVLRSKLLVALVEVTCLLFVFAINVSF